MPGRALREETAHYCIAYTQVQIALKFIRVLSQIVRENAVLTIGKSPRHARSCGFLRAERGMGIL